jgi:hypothetical protein
MDACRTHLTAVAVLAALLTPLSALAQMAPGSSGATTSSSSVQSLSTTTTTTVTLSRDQTFVMSGSNINPSGPLTVPGPALGGVTMVNTLPSTLGSSINLSQVNINVASGAAPVQALVLNPGLGITVRDPSRDFDLAVTQSTPGLAKAERSDTNTSTSQVSTSLSVFTAPFVP